MICLKLFRQVVRLALSLAALNAGNNNAARIPMTAMTTSSSIRVNALLDLIVVFIIAVRGKLVLQTAFNKPAFVRIVALDLQLPFADFAILEPDFVRHPNAAIFAAGTKPAPKRFAQSDDLHSAKIALEFVAKRTGITG